MSSDPTREFLVLLGRIETAVRRGCPQEEGNFDCGEDLEVWRAKVRSFEAALRERLSGLGVSESSAERYRSRIEELTPALEIALAEQRQAAATTEPEGEAADSTTPEPLLKQQQVNYPQVAVATAQVSAAELPATSTGQVASVAHSLASPSERKDSQQTNLPWRRHAEGQRSSTRERPAGGHAASRGNVESEMDDIVMQMKNAANSFNRTIKEDIAHLDDIDKSQTEGLDKVKGQTEKGKKFMRSNQLSFFCTMIMVAVSVIIVFMMIPFIIFT